MKILIVANKDITIYLFRKEFVEELIKLNYKVYILCPYGNKLEHFRNLGVNLIDYSIDRRGKNPFTEFRVLLKYNQVIKKIHPDYVFTYTIKPNIYMGIISRLRRIRFVPTITGLGSSLNQKGFLNRLIISLYRISFKRAYVAFFQNVENIEWFKTNINNKIHTCLVSGSGVNLDKFKYSELIPTLETRFLFLGRVMKDKGVQEFFTAARILKQKYLDNMQFKVAGFIEDDYRIDIEKLQSDGILTYIGFTNDTYSELIECSALVLPSYHEGLSNVLLEAQATGRPVVASNIPGCKETFIDGLSGLSVKVKNSDDLLEKMEHFHLLSDENKIKMSKNGRTHVEQNFDRKKVVREYISIIENGGQ